MYFVEARDGFVRTIIAKYCHSFCSTQCNVTIKIFYIFFIATMSLCCHYRFIIHVEKKKTD